MMTRAKVLMAVALLVGSATACSDVSGNNVTAEGLFSLRTVSNSSSTSNVPYSYVDQSTGHTIYIQSDQFVLASNGSYTEQQVYTDNGFQQFANETGSWSQSGNIVYFTPTVSDFSTTPYRGTVRNSSGYGGTRTLTISINGTTALYSD